MVTDLQSLASTAQNFFPEHHQPLHSNMPMSYPQHQPQNGSAQYYAPSSSYSYGNVSYVNHGGDTGNHPSLESHKQGLQSIRDLVMDARGGAFDARSYTQVGPRLSAIQNTGLPFLGGPSMGDYESGGGSPGGGVYAPTAHYALPIPNLRTKDDLIEADQVFQAMQTTIYDNANNIAAAGVGQPGAQLIAAMGRRQSHSPPGVQLTSAHYSNAAGTSQQSNHSATPDLSPPSSAHSQTSGNSPLSVHGQNMSPTTPSAMYPTLPGATSDTTANGYGSSSNMAPTSTLGSQFDNQPRRRYSGGRLQKAQPLDRTPKREEMDTREEYPANPKKNAVSSSSSEAGSVVKSQTRRMVDFSSSNLDPALGGTASPSSGEMDEGAIKANEMWIGNIRTIEALRTWLKQRLQNHEYESEGEEREGKEGTPSLYPVLAA